MTRCYVSRVAIPQYSETADLMLANRYAVSLMVHEIETRTAVTPSWAVPLTVEHFLWCVGIEAPRRRRGDHRVDVAGCEREGEAEAE